LLTADRNETQFFLTRSTWLAKRLGIKRLARPAIDITARFGEDPDVAEVDAYVRDVMQKGLNRLAAQRRFPVLG
jgi:hypothetical protein